MAPAKHASGYGVVGAVCKRWAAALAIAATLPHLGAQVLPLELQQPRVAERPQHPPQPLPPPPGQTQSLPALLRRVLPDHPQVRSARALLEATAERRLQARSRLGPTASVSVSQGRAAELEFGSSVDRRTDRAEAVLRWNLYNYGNDGAELRAAAFDERAAAQDLRRAQEEVCQHVAEIYIEVLRLQDLLPLAAERLESVRRLVQQARRQNELGKLSDADVQQAEASLLDAEIVHQTLLADHESARIKLTRTVGAGSVEDLRPLEPWPLRPTPTAVGTDPSNPDRVPGSVAAAQERALAARERVRPLASLLAPRIDLELHKQLSDRTSPMTSTEQQRAWLIAARWDFPVGGELHSRRNEAERRAEAAEAEALRVSMSVGAELASLPAQVAQAERAVVQLDKQVQRYNVLLRAGDLQFEAGRRNLAQLIQLRDSRYNAEQRRAEQASRLQKAMLSQLALSGELLRALRQDDLPLDSRP